MSMNSQRSEFQGDKRSGASPQSEVRVDAMRSTGKLDAGWLQVPQSLESQLLHFKRQVLATKGLEALAGFAIAVLFCLLFVFVAERIYETSAWLRSLLLIGLIIGFGLGVAFLAAWVMKTSGLERLAVLLGKKLPTVGDSMLGVIELAKNHEEQSRSPALCHAAMKQVADDSSKRDFLVALPNSHHRITASLAAILLTAFVGVFALYPAATSNSAVRLLAPWSSTPRYTFARVESLPTQWYVPHGEPINLGVELSSDSRWKPAFAEVRVGSQIPLRAELADGVYRFVLPPQIDPQPMKLWVGDTLQNISLEPTLRPELAEVKGLVRLPDYLGRVDEQEKDARSGSLSVLKGSTASVQLVASRELSSARIDGELRNVEEERFKSSEFVVDDAVSLAIDWTDIHGLAGRDPFNLNITALDDESPTLICEGLPRQAVVLDSEVLKFQIRASDDYGIKQVGILWRGVAENGLSEATEGERVLAAGGFDRDSLDVLGTFSAASLNIEPQPIELFVWTEDYLPGRPRVLSPPYVLYVLTPDQHAIWMTEQLSKWHRQALEVRDRELQLYETNKELRALDEEQLNLAETREKIQRQSQAEKSNGRRLDRLSQMGDELVRQAARNPEIGVGHLERWAEMLQVLKDISGNRMPTVADLLKEAAEAPRLAASTPPPKSGPAVGQIKNTKTGTPSEAKPAELKGPNAPQLVDAESSMNSPSEETAEPGKPKKPSKSALRLPVTTVMGKGKSDDEKDENQQEDSATLDPAVEAQEDLLAEFERLADELNAVLANLEGSTLVKRLKAESRNQYLIAGKIAESLDDSFGTAEARLPDEVAGALEEMSAAEEKSVQEVSYIMDDMDAYFERRRFAQFKQVLDDMRNEDVIGGIRQLTEEIKAVQGLSVAQCEYWSDALDRWAEDLVDPACSGQCPGGKSPASLPPSIVLEVLQVLEAEINLREETRVAEQAKEATSMDEYMTESLRLSQSQVGLQDRITKVIYRIGELPDADKHFVKELALLGQVDVVMGEAVEILAIPDCGPRAIAAETEAIELLLQSKRINPKSGGGGGSTPGGGGTGETTDSALALLGNGVNQKEVREDHGVRQTTGESGTDLPEEFRAGLDEYFNRIDGPATE